MCPAYTGYQNFSLACKVFQVSHKSKPQSRKLGKIPTIPKPLALPLNPKPGARARCGTCRAPGRTSKSTECTNYSGGRRLDPTMPNSVSLCAFHLGCREELPCNTWQLLSGRQVNFGKLGLSKHNPSWHEMHGGSRRVSRPRSHGKTGQSMPRARLHRLPLLSVR